MKTRFVTKKNDLIQLVLHCTCLIVMLVAFHIHAAPSPNRPKIGPKSLSQGPGNLLMVASDTGLWTIDRTAPAQGFRLLSFQDQPVLVLTPVNPERTVYLVGSMCCGFFVMRMDDKGTLLAQDKLEIPGNMSFAAYYSGGDHALVSSSGGVFRVELPSLKVTKTDLPTGIKRLDYILESAHPDYLATAIELPSKRMLLSKELKWVPFESVKTVTLSESMTGTDFTRLSFMASSAQDITWHYVLGAFAGYEAHRAYVLENEILLLTQIFGIRQLPKGPGLVWEMRTLCCARRHMHGGTVIQEGGQVLIYLLDDEGLKVMPRETLEASKVADYPTLGTSAS